MTTEGYVVKEIKLENVMSYDSLHLKMGPGSMGIVGNNGAGKSTLLESLYAALTAGHTLRFPGARGAHALLRRGARSGFIEITLEDGRGAVLVARVNLREKGSEYILKKKMPGNGQMKLLATRQEEYTRSIMEELGLSLPGRGGLRDFLSRAVIVPQGGLRQIAESMEKPEKLREEIEVAIGLPEYRKAVERLENLVIELEVEGEKQVFKIGPRVLAGVQENLRRTKARVEELENKRKDLTNREDNLRAMVEEARKKTEELEKASQEIILRLRELDILVQRMSEARKQLGDVEKKLEDARKRLGEALQAQEELKRLSTLKHLYERLPKYDNEKRSLIEKSHELTELENTLGRITRWIQLEKSVVEAQRLGEELEQRQFEADKARSQLSQVKALLQKTLTDKERVKREIAELRERLTSLAAHYLDHDVGEPDTILMLLRQKLEKQKETYEKAHKRLTELEALKRVRENSLKALREAQGDRCPLCGSPLDQAHRERVKRLLEDELARLEGELAIARRLWEEASLEQERLEETVSNIERLRDELYKKTGELEKLVEEARRLETQVEEWTSRVETLECALEELRKQYEKLQSLVWERNTLTRELQQKGIQDPHRAREYIELRLTQLRNEVERLEKSTSLFEEEVLRATGLQSLSEALDWLRRLGERIGRLAALTEEIPRLRELVEELEKDREVLINQIRELEEKVGERSKLREKLENIEEELARTRTMMETLENEHKKLIEERNRVEALLVENRRKARILEKQESLIKAGLAAKNAIEELMRSLYQRSLRRLETEMSRILESFDLEPTRVEIRDERGLPRLIVYTRSQAEAQVSELSGGEKTAVALAYVIALNTIMGAKIGFLALDEPTSELDEDRRKVLVRILSQLASPRGGVAPPLSQLLVVTHHTEVMDSVDTVCTVVKEGGRSSVSCIQPL